MTVEKDSKVLRCAQGGMYYMKQLLEEIADPASMSMAELRHLAGHIEYELKKIIEVVNLSPEDFYDYVWGILVKHAGASTSRDARRDFIFRMTETKDPTMEYRFQGTLGFGGKFWRDYSELKISCYSEDLTPKTKKTIEEVNGLLKELSAVYNLGRDS